MLGSPPAPGPLGAESLRAAHSAAVSDARRRPLPLLSGWGFVISAAIAVGCALGPFHGAGEQVATLNVIAAAGAASPPTASGAPGAPVTNFSNCPAFGPVALSPSMNPLRAVLSANSAQMGSARQSFEVALEDPSGATLWDRHGVLDGRDDGASYMKRETRLMDFEISRAGPYTLRVRFPAGSLDDLREATLELRGRVHPVNTRRVVGFGLAALACLLLNLISSKRSHYADVGPGDARREAA